MKLLVLGWLSGTDDYVLQPMVDAFVNSLAEIRAAGGVDVVLFTRAMTDEAIARFRRADIEVRKVDVPRPTHIFISRHRAYWQMLADEGDNYDWVLATDVRDVVFQEDPRPHLQRYPDSELLLLSELHVHKDNNNWNYRDQMAVHAKIVESGATPDISKWPIVNMGLVFGRPRMMKWLSLTIHSMGLYCQAGREPTDQAILNYLWNTKLCYDDHITVLDAREDPLGLIGHAVKARKTCLMPLLDADWKVCWKAQGPYAIVHQWDRIPMADVVLARWTGGDPALVDLARLEQRRAWLAAHSPSSSSPMLDWLALEIKSRREHLPGDVDTSAVELPLSNPRWAEFTV